MPQTETGLRAEGVSLSYDGVRVVEGLDFHVPTGKVTAIIGANGSGKSTVLKAFARILAPAEGRVLLDGRPVGDYPGKAYARRVGILPQQPLAPAGITVAELVSRGRAPHRGAFARPTAADREHVATALERTETLALADRRVEELSGGQRQRVWIAMALAQDPEVLLLDEPTTYLDLAHQVDVLDLLRDWNAARGTSIVMVLHELALAARAADHVVAMRDGRIVRQGSADDVLTQRGVAEVFDLDALVLRDPVRGTPLIVPRGRLGGGHSGAGHSDAEHEWRAAHPDPTAGPASTPPSIPAPAIPEEKP
ncbi:iron-dicitrate ABC transporter ATP-binding protein [Pseudoclavibacter endophyticus]|uniref:ABC transporter ATP-binding protein n=1 Tax=Pseudoclavibacter endophyticus TaxID=1778590 RepID=A0A6H9WQJ8_9MICO|nr:ABC transporter ATP-binding protein [Pseudoclavibacter endophyticus]KAB1649065.1 ABC transporter ATP-binding protein [Pseudoclavibacter endophyticus]GGA65748.1 iron-dicitrate ABC transporter ATP-binding protein [Pseudoclavibacter endophyticus]